MKKKALDIRNFTKEDFLKAIVEVESDYPEERIKTSDVFQYFYIYLKGEMETGLNKGFDATLMVIEDDYISKAFLEDYANSYARKFKPYSKFTRRLHFFETPEKNRSQFKNSIGNGKTNNGYSWWEDYIEIPVSQTPLFRKKQTPVIFVCLSINTDHTEVLRWGLK